MAVGDGVKRAGIDAVAHNKVAESNPNSGGSGDADLITVRAPRNFKEVAVRCAQGLISSDPRALVTSLIQR